MVAQEEGVKHRKLKTFQNVEKLSTRRGSSFLSFFTFSTLHLASGERVENFSTHLPCLPDVTYTLSEEMMKACR